MAEPTTNNTATQTTAATGQVTEPATTPMTFDEFLASNKDYQSAYDKKVGQAIKTREAALHEQHLEVLKTRDSDLAQLQEKLKDFDGTKSEFEALQTRYQKEAAESKALLESQAYEFAVRSAANDIDFTSKAAKNDFIHQATKAGLKLKDGSLLGFSDYVDAYKKDDPTAIKAVEVESTTKPAPTFVAAATGATTQTGWDLGFTPIRNTNKK